MKAILRDEYGSSDVLFLEEVGTPVPGPGEVLVRVRAASVNTADLDFLMGEPRAIRLYTGLTRPRRRGLGLDMAGVVEQVGEGVIGLSQGDAVWADMSEQSAGSFAEFVCAPEQAFHRKPNRLGFVEAATLPHSGVLALQGLLGKGPVRSGEKVLIIGAGGCVGPFAVQIARSLGAEVTAVDNGEKLDMLRDIGADHVIDYTREDFTRSGQRYHMILDIAAKRSVLAYRRSLTRDGRYVLIAHSLIGFFQAMILGSIISLGGGKRMGIFMWNPNRRDDLDLLAHMVETGQITPLIDRRFPLEEVPEALKMLADGQARGKLVIEPA